ncbi:hypothetical protein SETIT_1G333800v2 [Setaria italica]|uniref:Uncharacterized protein n=1 Tax=Setaria italica TaxID=4555 RepID=A0A368PRZ1_SETIT|nr:hypothetical protein SETIT_1G333800v2 [Setaria italica]
MGACGECWLARGIREAAKRTHIISANTCDVEHGDRQHESHLVTLTRLLYFYHLYACVTGCG